MTMPESSVAKIRKIEPPVIYKTNRGKERLVGGRWNMMRVSEFLRAKKTWQTMDDIARFVYGSTGQTHRDKTRKHIPSQRRYMLDKDMPFVTDYGPRGMIIRIKIYDQNNDDDKVKFQTEIGKARDKKEISERRYDDLVKLFLLR
jgi:hypothetical protein